jgi:signal transduction histidine kinase
MGIRARLLLYTLPLIIVPMCSLGFFSYRFLAQGFEEQLRLEGAQLCQMAASRIEQKLDECYANILVLQTEASKEWATIGSALFAERLRDGSALTARLAQRFAIRHSPFVQVRIVRADGEALLHAGGLDFAGMPRSALHDSIFLQAVAVGFSKRLPTQFPASMHDSTYHTTFAAPLFRATPEESLIGLVLLDLDIRSIDRILSEVNALQPGDYVVVDGAGQVLADHASPTRSRNRMIGMIRNLPRRLESPRQVGEGRDSMLMVQPVKEYIAFREPVSQERWYIGAAAVSSPLLAAFRNTQIAFLLILGTALSAGIMGSVFIARKITDPIGNLTTAVQRFAQGDLEGNIPIKTNDEIGMLTSDVNRMANELRNLMRERQTNETLLAIGRVSASLVHDLRNPVEGLKLLSSELIKRVKRDGDAFEVADTIYQSAGRLSSLLAQSLDFSRLSHPEFLPTDIVALANDAVAGIRTGGVVVTKKFDDQLPLVAVDAVQIKRVLTNILQNAVDACRNKPLESPGIVECVLRSESSAVKIEITDNGSGIPAESREKIFDPFFTTKPEGHGLGLSFARQILKNHGGTLTCTSEVGKGTRFVAVLPIAQPSHILGSVLT